MVEKYLFFRKGKGLITNMFIILQVALWVYFISSLLSLVLFNDRFIKLYKKNFSLQNGLLITFDKPQLDGKVLNIENLIKSFNENDIKYGVCIESGESIGSSVIGATQKEIKGSFASESYNEDLIKTVSVNNHIINYLTDINSLYISELNVYDWNSGLIDNKVPIIVGNNFKNILKINDEFEYEDTKYIVKGILEKNTILNNGYNTIVGTVLIDNKILLPINDNQIVESFSYEPFSIYSENNYEKSKDVITSIADKNLEALTFKDFNKDLNVYINDMNFEMSFEIIKNLIMTILTTISILITLAFKIKDSKDVIGILYTVGISKRRVFYMFITEFLSLMIIAAGIGIIFVTNGSEYVFKSFYNNFLYVSLLITLILLILIILIALVMSFKNINKLTPKEIMKGFIE